MKSFPALRGTQGDRVFYVLLPTLDDLTHQFSPEVEPHDQRAQRALDPRHANAIASYLEENRSGYVLGALTYAMDEEGTFLPLDESGQLGTLTLAEEISLRSIDGQHRRSGAAEALVSLEDLKTDRVAVVLYVEQDLAARRQMFSDMNWTPRKVTNTQNIAFDSRDPFSRVTRDLAKAHPFLRGRVEMEKARIVASSDKLFTLATVYEMARRLELGPNRRMRSYKDLDERHIYDRTDRLLQTLGEARPEIGEDVSADELRALRERSILPSQTTLRVIAGAAHVCTKYHQGHGTEFALSDLVGPLGQVPFEPDNALWIDCGFVTPGKSTPNARNQEIVQATNRLAAEMLGLANH